MELKERIKYIVENNKIKPNISIYEFAKSVGTYPAKFAEIQSGKVKKLSQNIALEISKQYGFEFLWILTGEGDIYSTEKNSFLNNDKAIDYYPDVYGSCGTGLFIQSSARERLIIPKNNFNLKDSKNYAVINAQGDSMYPSIENGDKVIIEQNDFNDIIDNNIYLFSYEDKVFLKRLVYNVQELVIKSDNPDKDTYRTQHITKEELNNVRILGKVVGIMRTYQ